MERISALMDGELERDEARRLLDAIKAREDLQFAWSTFHVIGDAMREGRHLPADYAGRLSARLAQEPTILAPRAMQTPRWQRYTLPAFAAAAAVAAVTWVVGEMQGPLVPQAPLAGAGGAGMTATAPASPAATPTASIASTAVPSPTIQIQPAGFTSRANLNDYLFAHQEYSPSTAIQGVVSYIRAVPNASAEPNR